MKKLLIVFLCILCSFISGCKDNLDSQAINQSSEAAYIYDCGIIYETASDMMDTFDTVATFEITATRSAMYDQNQETGSYMLVSEARVINAYSGSLKNNDKVYLLQNGDGVNEIWQSIDETLGYYKKGQKYLAFVSPRDLDTDFRKLIDVGSKPVFSAFAYSGQYLIDENGNILEHPSNYDLFPDAKSVDEIISEIK